METTGSTANETDIVATMIQDRMQMIQYWRETYAEYLRMQQRSHKPQGYNELLDSVTKTAEHERTKIQEILNGQY